METAKIARRFLKMDLLARSLLNNIAFDGCHDFKVILMFSALGLNVRSQCTKQAIFDKIKSRDSRRRGTFINNSDTDLESYIKVIRCISQDLESGCPKLTIVKYWDVLLFNGGYNILRLQP